MGIFSFFRGSEPGWVSSKDIWLNMPTDGAKGSRIAAR